MENANALIVTSVAAKANRIAKLCAELDQVAGSDESGFDAGLYPPFFSLRSSICLSSS